MLLAERSIRLLVVIMIGLLIGWKVRQHRLGSVSAAPVVKSVPNVEAGSTVKRAAFPDE